MEVNLATNAKITWCPGCTNSLILVAVRQALESLIKSGQLKQENVVACAGIGCHGKISDYLNVNSFTALHGRVIPAMTGIKCANPELKVIGFSGDGDSFDEGLEHLIHAAKRNSNVTLFVHNNQLFALTTGQATAVSPKGFKGKSTPFGSLEEPLDPIALLQNVGATFIARAYAGDLEGTKKIMEAAILHQGFAFVEIIQPCVTFFDTREEWKKEIAEGRVKLGIIEQIEKPTFEEQLWQKI